MSRVLLIESDILLAKNIAGALLKAGHEVVHTSDAQAAVTAADARTPDVVILDLLLAGRSGAEFLYELRSYPDWKSIPVIIYSNVKKPELPLPATELLGVGKVFYKPATSLGELTAEVARLTRAAV